MRTAQQGCLEGGWALGEGEAPCVGLGRGGRGVPAGGTWKTASSMGRWPGLHAEDGGGGGLTERPPSLPRAGPLRFLPSGAGRRVELGVMKTVTWVSGACVHTGCWLGHRPECVWTPLARACGEPPSHEGWRALRCPLAVTFGRGLRRCVTTPLHGVRGP